MHSAYLKDSSEEEEFANGAHFTVKAIGESYLKDESDDYRIGKEYGVTTHADVMGSDVDDLHSDDFRKDFEEESCYDTEENIKKIRESAIEVEGRRCKTQEQLDKLTKEGDLETVKDFMADFEADEEYYEDDYDYGEGLASSHRVRSESILDLHYSDEMSHLRQRERSDSILNIDYTDEIDKSTDRSMRVLPSDKDMEYEDSSLRVDFDYRDEISDYENEIFRDDPPVLSKKLVGGIQGSGSGAGTSATLDRLNAGEPYSRTFGRFGSRSRLESIRSCIARDPCRRVLSSDAVWLSSSPARGKKYKSYDEMMKKKHVVRFK